MKAGPRTPWWALACLGAVLGCAMLSWAVGSLHLTPPPCLLKATLGVPCATCGGTRCALALAHGQIREAFHWHPVLAALALFSPLAVLWDLRRAWRKDPYPAPPAGWRLPAIAALLLAATWVLQVARGL